MKRFLLVVGLGVGLTAALPACTPRLFHDAFMVAAIVGTVAVLAHHDAHMHDAYCGCDRRWHEGRWVYYYGGHWEYYDPHYGQWYYYED